MMSLSPFVIIAILAPLHLFVVVAARSSISDFEGGEPAGSDSLADVDAACTTDRCQYRRIQQCCRDSGERIGNKKDCLNFCRFNVTGRELDADGADCRDQMQVLMYCASEGVDHASCCRKDKRIPKLCYPFCQGDVSRLCPDDVLYNYHECIDVMEHIMQCHRRALSTLAKQWSVKSKAPKMRQC